MIERISQTFIKYMKSYLAGEECGNIIRHIFVDQRPFNLTSKWMEVGTYFEFLLTGAVPKSGIIPKPVYQISPLKKKPPEKLTVEDMMEDYRRAHANAAQVKRHLADMKLEIVVAGKHIVKGRFEGTIDLIVRAKESLRSKDGINWEWQEGEMMVFDVKYSGLIEDKWKKFGWAWTPIQKEYNRPQAVQYHFLTELPFSFLVVQNNNKSIGDVFQLADVRLFRIPVSEEMLKAHIQEGNHLLGLLALEEVSGFKARPALKKCWKCPIAVGCPDKIVYPESQAIEL